MSGPQSIGQRKRTKRKVSNVADITFGAETLGFFSALGGVMAVVVTGLFVRLYLQLTLRVSDRDAMIELMRQEHKDCKARWAAEKTEYENRIQAYGQQLFEMARIAANHDKKDSTD